jgi:hypothetical protein
MRSNEQTQLLDTERNHHPKGTISEKGCKPTKRWVSSVLDLIYRTDEQQAVHKLRIIEETPGEWADYPRAIQEVDRTERNLPTVAEQLHWDTTVDESSLSDEERRGILDRRATRWSRTVEIHDEGVNLSDNGWLSLVEPMTGVQTTLSNGHGLFTLPLLEGDSIFLSIGTNGSSGDGSQSSISSSPPNISSSLPVPQNYPNFRPWDGKSKFPDMPFSNWQSFPH